MKRRLFKVMKGSDNVEGLKVKAWDVPQAKLGLVV